MPNQSNNATNVISSSVQTNASLVTNNRFAVQSHITNGLIASTNHSLLDPSQVADKKNHRWLSMIFFVLGMLVIFRLTHG